MLLMELDQMSTLLDGSCLLPLEIPRHWISWSTLRFNSVSILCGVFLSSLGPLDMPCIPQIFVPLPVLHTLTSAPFLALLNASSLANKMFVLNDLFKSQQLDFPFLTETVLEKWIYSQLQAHLHVNGILSLIHI